MMLPEPPSAWRSPRTANSSRTATILPASAPIKKFGDGKVCSETAISDRQYLLAFTPADITVKIDGDEILKSASGIYEYTVGRGEHYLTAETNALGVRAVREDTGAELTKSGDDFLIPDDFSGTLMIRISAVSLSGITDEFLLISRDDGDISLTLENDIIYADRKTGAYKVSGAAEPEARYTLSKTRRQRPAATRALRSMARSRRTAMC